MTGPTRSDKNDAELIQRLLNGEEAAFREAVQSFQGPMLKVARAIVGEAIADEVVQEAWLSVIKALPRFEKRSSLKTWILRIVGNTAKSRLRHESRTVAAGDGEESYQYSVLEGRFNARGHWQAPPRPWKEATSPDDILASEQLRQRIEAAIDQLPPMQQSVLILRDQAGLAMDEICKILEISESNSRVLLHRARAKLWQAIENYEAG